MVRMGEFELLARIRERLPAGGPRTHLGSGDDAAVTVPGGATATSVDALVDGVHFRRDLASPAQIGHKALATALSDLAAMGAEAGEAYVALGIPPDFGEEDCLELLDGMAALAGADRHRPRRRRPDPRRASSSWRSPWSATRRPRTRFVTRAGAQPGDALVLTGEIGGAAAGLELLQNANRSISPSTRGSNRPLDRGSDSGAAGAPARAHAAAGGRTGARAGRSHGDDRPQRRARRRRRPPGRRPVASSSRSRPRQCRWRPARVALSGRRVATPGGCSAAARTTSCWRASRRTAWSEATAAVREQREASRLRR